MMESARDVGVVLARQSVDHMWADHVWTPHAILSEPPATLPGSLLSEDHGTALVYAGPATIQLFVNETTNYRDNLQSGAPRLWVACRSREGLTPELVAVTADPTEGEALFESGCDIVGVAAVPDAVGEWIAGFVDTFHVERVFLKRQRDRSEKDPRKHRGEPDR